MVLGVVNLLYIYRIIPFASLIDGLYIDALLVQGGTARVEQYGRYQWVWVSNFRISQRMQW